MTKQRDSFIFYRSFYDASKALDDENRLALLDAIFEFALNHTETELEALPDAMFKLIKPQLEANYAKWQNGNKGGRPKTPETKKKPKQNLTKTKPKPNVNENDNENVNEKKKQVKRNTPRFVKPTLAQVEAYCIERNNGIDPQAFIDHYEANGWVQGKGKPIKSWQACVRTWENNRRDQQQIQDPIMALASQGPMYGDSI